MYQRHVRWIILLMVSTLFLSTAIATRAEPTSTTMQTSFDCATVTEIPQSECEALISLYDATGGDSWNTNTDWLATNTPCSWYGVTCGDENVSQLSLIDNQLSGAIPPEIGDLTALTSLWLSINQLSGPIPSEIGNLNALTYLNLRNNQLTGPIPIEIGNLTALRSLYLYNNQLSGAIPSEIGNLTALLYLDLSRNQLSGSIPSEISSLTALTHLDLSSNQLSGAIPPGIGNLTALTVLFLSANQLSGSIPSEIYDLNALTWLWLFNNQLTGYIPPEIGNLGALRGLVLCGNELTGHIPSQIGNLTALNQLNLSGNQLSGSIPSEIGNLATSTHLDLSGNQLSGVIPPEIGNLTALTDFNLSSNQLSGPIPPQIGNLIALTSLWLSNNQLSGPIPPAIGNLTALTVLQLWGNQLSGPIPPEIGDLIALTDFNLSSNQLSGPIPPQIGNLIALTSLRLSNNQLSGPIPPAIGNLTAITVLQLWGNQLSGPIPPEIGDLIALTALSLSSNQLSGSIPPEIGNLTLLTTLLLSGNQLTGPIPHEIGNLTALTYLFLSYNQLSEPIPPQIGDLTALSSLYLDDNQLSGAIPSEIANMTALGELYLSNNQLSGPVPSELGNLTALTSLSLHDNFLEGQIPASLTSLTQLNQFTFYDTNVCIPPAGDVPAWLSGIPNLYGTGFICGQDLGSLSGTVMLTDMTPAAGIQVNLYRSLPWSRWRHVTTTQTVAAGTYQFASLGQGLGIDYRVRFVDPTHQLAPQYYDDKRTLAAATVITITPGIPRAGIDAVLALPQSPAVGVDTDTGSVIYNPDGTAQITLPAPYLSDVVITRAVTCPTGTPSIVTLQLSTGLSYPMAYAGGNMYQATIPTADLTGNATLSVAVTCNGDTTTVGVGSITLYEPSGVITNLLTGQPVEGATVTLYHVPDWESRTGPDDERPNTCESNLSKPAGAPWSQPAPTHLGVIANADVTPTDPRSFYQQTTAAGYYGWEVSAGCWYVTVEAAGYEPLVSPVVGALLELAGLDLILKPEMHHIYLPLALRDYVQYFEGPWEVEPNNEYWQANGSLLLGQNYYGYPNDAKDYFSIYTRQAGEITVDLTGHIGVGVQLLLWRGAPRNDYSNLVGSRNASPYRITYTGPAGWYYIYIYTAGGYNTTIPYTLRVTYPQ